MELGALHGPLWPHTRSSLGCSHVALAACEWFPLIRSRFPPDFPLTKSHRPRGELGATTASTYHFYYSYTQCHWCPPRSISPLTILSHVRKLASYLAMSISPRFLAVAAVLAGAMYSAATVAADTPGGSCPYPCLPPPIAGGAVNSYPPPPPAGSSSSSSSGGGDGGAGGLFGGTYPPPPPGVMPGAFAPPFGGGFPYGPAPPPPNPILPWFPWYYQHNNPITGSTTSAAAVGRTPASMVTTVVLLPLFLVALLRVL